SHSLPFRRWSRSLYPGGRNLDLAPSGTAVSRGLSPVRTGRVRGTVPRASARERPALGRRSPRAAGRGAPDPPAVLPPATPFGRRPADLRDPEQAWERHVLDVAHRPQRLR